MRRVWGWIGAVLLAGATLAAPPSPASLPSGSVSSLSAPVGDNLRGTLDSDGEIFLIVTPQRGDAWTRLARRTTGDAANWKAIQTLNAMGDNLEHDRKVRVPFAMLRPELRTSLITALFPEDTQDKDYWRHKIVSGNDVEGESLWKLAEWFTGDGANYQAIRAANRMSRLSTRRGETILIPETLLAEPFRLKAPPVATSDKKPQPVEDDPVDSPARATPPSPVAGTPAVIATTAPVETEHVEPPALEYEASAPEPYAIYRLRRGEALYSSVAVRFTGRVYVDDVNEVVQQIVQFNGIEDVARLPVGYPVRIPMSLLDAEHRPAGDPKRLQAEVSKRESRRVTPRVEAKDLRGVNIILDAGHGGRDVGTFHDEVWESDYVYDVMCRLKAQLEKKTGATVSVTTRSKGAGYAVSTGDMLVRRTDHVVLTSPEYGLENPVVGVHLRWYLANSLFRRAIQASIDAEKVVFISLHADSLHPSLRGAMAYVPGEAFVQGTYEKKGKVYLARSEVRESPSVTQSEDDALVAAGLSTQLAESIMDSLRAAKLKVHPANPVRDNVVRDGREWVPAVIRYNKIPTRMLLEICNLGNPEDVKLMKTAKYREAVATAIRKGIVAHFAEQAQPHYEMSGKAAAK